MVDDSSRQKAMKLLSLLPCALGGHLIFQGKQQISILEATCALCDGHGTRLDGQFTTKIDPAITDEMIIILEEVVDSPHFKESPKLRILGILALRRYIEHLDSTRLSDIELSSLAQWCVRSLRSTIRELRIAARYARPCC